jgi:hypothetical protein
MMSGGHVRRFRVRVGRLASHDNAIRRWKRYVRVMVATPDGAGSTDYLLGEMKKGNLA